MLNENFCGSEKDFCELKMLNGFLPDKIYDAHAHFFPSSSGGFAGVPAYRNSMSALLGSPRVLSLNLIPFPEKEMADKSSPALKNSCDFLFSQLDGNPDCSGEIAVLPNDTYDDILSRINGHKISGFKCYHTFCGGKDTFSLPPESYLPEAALQIADEKGLCITLHLVKDGALSDGENLAFIKKAARRYKNAVIILAHNGRSFAAKTAFDTVGELAPYPNVFFDFSAVCESPALFMTLKKVGVSRCMWGSDFPVCGNIGKAVSLGDGFCWVKNTDLGGASNLLVLSENLLAVRQAAVMADLSRMDVEDLFYNNARRLFVK